MIRRIVLCLGALAMAAPAAAQDHDQDAAMKAWMEAAKPGPNHAMLASLAGDWDVHVTSYDNPAGPVKSTGTSTKKMLLDGRYLYEEFAGTMMDMPFQGIGITGFDNITGKFQTVWMDNFGTLLMYGTGDMKDGTMVMMMEMTEPMSKQKLTMKGVTKLVSADKYTYEMYMLMGDQEMKSMEIEYTRKK